MIINDSIRINESSKLDVSGIEVSSQPFNYEGFHGVTLEGTTPQSKRNLDNRGFLNSLEKLLGYVIQTSGFNGVVRVNIKNKNFKDAYNDIKKKLEDQLSESIKLNETKAIHIGASSAYKSGDKYFFKKGNVKKEISADQYNKLKQLSDETRKRSKQGTSGRMSDVYKKQREILGNENESIESDPDKELDENPTFLDRMKNSASGETFNVFSGSKNYKVTNLGGGKFKVIGGKGWDKPSDAYLKKIVNSNNEVSKDALVNFIKMINKKMGYRESLDDTDDSKELNESSNDIEKMFKQYSNKFNPDDVKDFEEEIDGFEINLIYDLKLNYRLSYDGKKFKNADKRLIKDVYVEKGVIPGKGMTEAFSELGIPRSNYEKVLNYLADRFIKNRT